MATIKQELWDAGVSSPAVVAGWVFNPDNTNLIDDTNGGIVQSSPNSLAYTAGGAVKDIIYNTTDSVSGATKATTYFYTGAITTETDLVLFNRMTSASPSTSAVMYQVQIALGSVYSAGTGGILFGYWSAGFHYFPGCGPIGFAAFGSNKWYKLVLSCNGSTISCQVQDVATGNYLNASNGLFDLGSATDLYSVTDTHVTGAGKAGMQMASNSTVYTDNFLWESFSSPVSYTITPPAQPRIGVAGTYIITCSGAVPSNTQITVTELGGLGGTFTQPTVILTGGSSSTFTYTPNGAAGSRTLHFVNDKALVNPSDQTYSVVRAAGTFYISAAGNDSNAGTIGSPWLTVAKVVSQGILTGDTYNFRGGDNFTPASNLVYDGGGNLGTIPQTIKFQSYGGGQATITISNNSLSAFKFTNTGAIWVDNIHFAGPNSGVSALGAAVEFWTNSAGSPMYDNCAVTNCLITGFRYGTHFWNANVDGGAACTAGYVNAISSMNVIHDCWGKGTSFWVEASLTLVMVFANPTVSHNTIYNIPGNPIIGGTTDDASAQGITIGKCDGGLCEWNIIYNVGVNNKDAGGIVTADCRLIFIRRNEIHDITTASVDGYGIDIDRSSEKCIIEDNHIHECVGAGLATFQFNPGDIPNVFMWTNSHNHFRYNILQNCGSVHSGCILVQGGYTTDTYFYNNTIYNTANIANTGVLHFTNATDTRFTKYIYFYNNLIISIGGQRMLYHPVSSIPVTMKFNVLYTTASGGTTIYTRNGVDYTSLAAFQSGSGGAAASNISTNPNLANISTVTTVSDITGLQSIVDAILSIGSNAIDAGIDVTASPYDVDLDSGWVALTTDFAGTIVPVGGTFDIGAMEYVAARSFSVGPSYLAVHLTGTGTTWSGSPFSIISPAGVSIVTQVVNAVDSADLKLNLGIALGPIVISDGFTQATITNLQSGGVRNISAAVSRGR